MGPHTSPTKEFSPSHLEPNRRLDELFPCDRNWGFPVSFDARQKLSVEAKDIYGAMFKQAWIYGIDLWCPNGIVSSLFRHTSPTLTTDCLRRAQDALDILCDAASVNGQTKESNSGQRTIQVLPKARVGVSSIILVEEHDGSSHGASPTAKEASLTQIHSPHNREHDDELQNRPGSEAPQLPQSRLDEANGSSQFSPANSSVPHGTVNSQPIARRNSEEHKKKYIDTPPNACREVSPQLSGAGISDIQCSWKFVEIYTASIERLKRKIGQENEMLKQVDTDIEDTESRLVELKKRKLNHEARICRKTRAKEIAKSKKDLTLSFIERLETLGTSGNVDGDGESDNDLV